MSSKLSNIIFFAGAFAFLLVGFLGVYHMSMAMGDDGRMDNCPFARGDMICTMTPLDHVTMVRSLLTALPQEKNALASIVLDASVLSLFVLFFIRLLAPPNLLLARNRSLTQEYVPLGNFLQEAFSRGILHTKVF